MVSGMGTPDLVARGDRLVGGRLCHQSGPWQVGEQCRKAPDRRAACHLPPGDGGRDPSGRICRGGRTARTRPDRGLQNANRAARDLFRPCPGPLHPAVDWHNLRGTVRPRLGGAAGIAESL